MKIYYITTTDHRGLCPAVVVAHDVFQSEKLYRRYTQLDYDALNVREVGEYTGDKLEPYILITDFES